MPTPKYTNSLIHEKSPYLLQHAHNPVDWMPWNEATLQKAKEENKLILVSVGYSACHWCHVMEHESFEDESVAEVMNKYFVCIKVDREERATPEPVPCGVNNTELYILFDPVLTFTLVAVVAIEALPAVIP